MNATFFIGMPKENRQKFALKEIRIKKDISRHELSKLSKIHEDTIKSLEMGINEPLNAKLSTLVALAKALGCKVRDFYPDEKSI